MHTFYSKVVGVTQKNGSIPRQEIIKRYCRAGKQLLLFRQPKNRHDKNAIAVVVRFKMLFLFERIYQIGYLPADLAEDLAPYMDNGGEIECSISEITGGTRGKKTLGVNIMITTLGSF